LLFENFKPSLPPARTQRKMGNSSSKKSVSLVNDGLQVQLAAPDDCQALVFRATQQESAHAKDSKILSPGEKLETALAPFQRLLTLEPPPEAAPPKEQELLLQCLRANQGNSLACHKEVHDFVGFVNQLTLCTPSGL